MNWDFVLFFTNSLLLAVGLAMDAFSVSLANGLNEPKMRLRKVFGVAGIFSLFQAIMPLVGWFCVHTLVQYFKFFEKLLPWIALILLCYIGGKMLSEATKTKKEHTEKTALSFPLLIVQGVATSIDALSVGFTIVDYDITQAIGSAIIIGVTTFFICTAGIIIGKNFGTKLSTKASVFGGIILILIGIEIFVTGIF